MANILNFQTLEDGNENTIIRLVGELPASGGNVTSTVFVDPALLSDIGPFTGRKATQLRVKKVAFDVEDTLAVQFFWDATTPVLFEECVGRGIHDYKDAGGLQNNAGAGKTGKITFVTEGWVTNADLVFTITLYLGKQV